MLRFRLGRIPVEVHTSHWVLAVLIAYSFLPASAAGGAGALGGQNLLPLLLVGVAVVFVSLLVHELGHALVGLAFGYRPSIQLVMLGGLTQPNAPGPIPWWRDVILTAAGPFFGFLLYIGAKLASPYVPQHLVWAGFGMWMLINANLYWSLFNLVPVIPLDGGRISQVLFTRVFGRKGLFASLGLGAAVSLVLAFLGMRAGDFFIGIFFGMFAAQAVGQILSIARASPVSQNDPAVQALARASEAMRAQDLDGAAQLAQAVLDRDPPAHPEVRSRAHHVLGWIAIKRGEGRLALDHFSQVQGQAVEPAALAAAFSLIGDDERSLPLWELAFKQTQDRTVLHEWAGALIRAGKVDRARALPGLDLSSAYGCAERVLFLRERFSEAAAAAVKRVELKPTAEAAYDAACALSRAGDRERAVSLLEQARTLGFDDLGHAATDPDLAALHGHPRFQALLGGLKTATP